jgi:hypothetical protein
MKNMESRKWGQIDKYQLTAKGDLTGFIARLKSEATRVAAVTKADERRPNFIAIFPPDGLRSRKRSLAVPKRSLAVLEGSLVVPKRRLESQQDGLDSKKDHKLARRN